MEDISEVQLIHEQVFREVLQAQNLSVFELVHCLYESIQKMTEVLRVHFFFEPISNYAKLLLTIVVIIVFQFPFSYEFRIEVSDFIWSFFRNRLGVDHLKLPIPQLLHEEGLKRVIRRSSNGLNSLNLGGFLGDDSLSFTSTHINNYVKISTLIWSTLFLSKF